MSASSLRLGICAGEASGDILAGSVLNDWQETGAVGEITGIGGPQTVALGLQSLAPMERLAVMGLVEPLKRLPELLRIRRQLIAQQLKWQPDLFLGVDSPDFNLPVERRLRAAGITTAHLVSPSVWAWRSGRIRSIRQSVDKMLCLLPFEVDIYKQAGIDAVCVGHPLVDDLKRLAPADAVRQQLGLARENDSGHPARQSRERGAQPDAGLCRRDGEAAMSLPRTAFRGACCECAAG